MPDLINREDDEDAVFDANGDRVVPANPLLRDAAKGLVFGTSLGDNDDRFRVNQRSGPPLPPGQHLGSGRDGSEPVISAPTPQPERLSGGAPYYT